MDEISVVIPNYNSEYISRTLSSIPRMKKIEIIIVDDNSTKEYMEKCRNSGIFDGKKLIHLPIKGYASLARNVGIINAKYEHILFLDSDVILKEGCLEKLANEIKNNGTDIVFPKILFENSVPMYPKHKEDEEYPSITAAFMIKKSSLKRLDKLFDTKYGMCFEDTDFFYRCRLAGLKAQYVPDAVIYHVIKESPNAESQFYLYVRNYTYGSLKYFGLKNHPFGNLIRFLAVKFFVNGLLNYEWRDSYHEKEKNKLKLFFKHKKITNKTSLYLFYLFFKAIGWNVKNLKETLSERKKVISFYNSKV